MEGNREVDEKHVRRLYVSILDNGWVNNPIIVNEKMQVVDGQHRLAAAKMAKSEITYIIQEGYSLQQVHSLNLNQKNWTKRDYMVGYANKGLKSYVKLADFVNRNSDFNITDCVAMCSNTSSGTNFSNAKVVGGVKGVKSTAQNFEGGTWTGKDFNLAQDNADKLRAIGEYYKNYNKATFVGTMLQLFSNPNFSYNVFMAKLKSRPLSLKDAATREQCKLMVEDIYNYRSQNKVNLRY